MESSTMSVSKQDAILVAIVCATLGAVLSWIVFCSPGGTWITEDKGSAADWLAAIFGAVAAAGTWAIGIGANRYARQAQALQEWQVGLEVSETARHRAAQIRQITVWTRICRQPYGGLSDLVDDLDGDDPPDIGAATGAVAGNRDLLKNIDWESPGWMLLSEEGIEAKIQLQVAVRAYDFMCTAYVDNYDMHSEGPDPQLDPSDAGFHLLLRAAMEIRAMADEVLVAIRSIRSMGEPVANGK